MFDRRALADFANTLTVATRDLSGPESRKLLHQTARAERERVLGEQRQRSGIAPTDIVAADGRRGAPIEQAERLVVIEYGYLREVVQEVLKVLVMQSPKRTGAFARAFAVLVNGAEIHSLDQIVHDTREAVIVNTMPYARRLEVGKSRDGTPFVVQVRPRFIEATALAMRSRFGNVAQLWFNYFDIDGAHTLRRAARGGGRSRRAGAAIRYPGIRIVAL
jgi:hypothetical protein